MQISIRNNMGTHMKTTVEISDALLDAARKVAAREGTSVRALIERGLRQALFASMPRRVFRLRKATFKGRGLSSDAKGTDWQQLRELALQHDVRELWSADRDFGRFPDLAVSNPLIA